METQYTLRAKLVQQLLNKIRLSESRIKMYKEEFADNYERFLTTYAKKMYIEELCLKEYNNALTNAKTCNVDTVFEYVHHVVEHYTDDLIYSKLQIENNNAMENIAYSFKMQAKQRLIIEFTLLYRIKE